jgi:hypothetical protein
LLSINGDIQRMEKEREEQDHPAHYFLNDDMQVKKSIVSLTRNLRHILGSAFLRVILN